MIRPLILLPVLLLTALTHAQHTVKTVRLPDREPQEPVSHGTLLEDATLEPSGLTKSRMWDDIFWTLNDSGDVPRLFAVDRNGITQRTGGTLIPDAVNVDWEAMTIDNHGHLIIGDVGNNGQARRDLCLYYILEPFPETGRTSVFKKVFFRYPDQTGFPSPVRNFDCEGIFWANGYTYILSKNRSDSHVKLYRLDRDDPHVVHELTWLDTFDLQGQATGADVSEDGSRLVILAYNAIWLFDHPQGKPEAWFDGSIHWLPISIGQCEAVALDDDSIFITSVEGEGNLYSVPIADLIPIRQ